MKTKLLFTSLVVCAIANAQPVIQNGNNFPAVGTTGGYYAGTCTVQGSAGANQTWNFSSGTVHSAGTYTYINHSTSPFASTFPTATGCVHIDSTGCFPGNGIYSGYNYGKVTATEYGSLCYNYNSIADSCKSYTTPIMYLKFPFAYNDALNDTATGACQNNHYTPVSLTYDGYGTLTTPLGSTYTNVVRVKMHMPDNSLQYYYWSLNPLMVIFLEIPMYNNMCILYGGVSTGIDDPISEKEKISIYPNPFSSNTTIQFNHSVENAELNIFNCYGQKVKSMNHVSGDKIKIEKNNLTSGIYFIRVMRNNTIIAADKLIITD